MSESNHSSQAQDMQVNDFVMTICTVNGSGSATANTTLFRALFSMGIPTSGKNIFPSNIKGMATWFVIRASAQGFTGRKLGDDIIVAVNPKSLAKDISYLHEGGVVFYADHLALPEDAPENLIYYPMPIKELMKGLDVPRNLRDYTENMLYVGIVSEVLGITKDALMAALNKHFAGKPAIAEANFKNVELAYDWAAANLEKKDVYTVEEMPPSTTIMTDGDIAAGLGSLFGGMRILQLVPHHAIHQHGEAMIEWAPRLRKDPEDR